MPTSVQVLERLPKRQNTYLLFMPQQRCCGLPWGGHSWVLLSDLGSSSLSSQVAPSRDNCPARGTARLSQKFTCSTVLRGCPQTGHSKQDVVTVSTWAFLPRVLALTLTPFFPIHPQERFSLSRSTTGTQTSLLHLTAPLATTPSQRR